MLSIELFAGAGGLALGASRAGFDHMLIAELNKYACQTLEKNRDALKLLSGEEVASTDVSSLDFKKYNGQIDLLSGGPPCQPFSHGGKQRGDNDKRNMFPEFIRAVSEIQPKAIFIENVRGLKQFFNHYLESILAQLATPSAGSSAKIQSDATSQSESLRLSSGSDAVVIGLDYTVYYKLINCADYGIPQIRHRIMIVAIRNDLGVSWTFPQATHSCGRLLYDQWVRDTYWEEHRISDAKKPRATKKKSDAIKGIQAAEKVPEGERWMTVRDALRGLPQPEKRIKTKIPNHSYVGGARTYDGHEGSPWDEPAKTLKAGVHGVPGGENMLRNVNGKVRYFTIRECARIQTFPDSYAFAGPWGQQMRQVGNSVPVAIAELMCRKIARVIGTAAVKEFKNAG